jgi:hypothetical protein
VTNPRQYNSVAEMMEKLESCSNCRHEDDPESHPNCTMCIEGTGDGWEPKSPRPRTDSEVKDEA